MKKLRIVSVHVIAYYQCRHISQFLLVELSYLHLGYFELIRAHIWAICIGHNYREMLYHIIDKIADFCLISAQLRRLSYLHLSVYLLEGLKDFTYNPLFYPHECQYARLYTTMVNNSLIQSPN